MSHGSLELMDAGRIRRDVMLQSEYAQGFGITIGADISSKKKMKKEID